MANGNALNVPLALAQGEALIRTYWIRTPANTFIDFATGYDMRFRAVDTLGAELLNLTNDNGGFSYQIYTGDNFEDGLGDRSVAILLATSAQTVGLAVGTGKYDLFMIDPAGNPKRLFYGPFVVEAAIVQL